jgi:hypothetical protein
MNLMIRSAIHRFFLFADFVGINIYLENFDCIFSRAAKAIKKGFPPSDETPSVTFYISDTSADSIDPA